MYMVAYGERIRQRRLQLNLSQQDLADALFVTAQTVSFYEREKTKIPLASFSLLCNVLKLDFDAFVKGEIVESDKAYPDFDPDGFKNALAYLRERRKVVLKEVSDKTEISIKRLSLFENGNSVPSIQEFIALADYYDIPHSTLYFCLKEEASEEKETSPTLEDGNKKKEVRPIVWILIVIAIVILIAGLAIYFSGMAFAGWGEASSSGSAGLPPVIGSIEVAP